MDRRSRKEILAPASGSGDASKCDCSGLNLRGVELLGMSFDGSDLRGTDLACAELDGLKYDGDLGELIGRYVNAQSRKRS